MFDIPTILITKLDNIIKDNENETEDNKTRNLFCCSKNPMKNVNNKDVTAEQSNETALEIDKNDELQTNEESFHNAISWIIVVAQVVGLMPLRGVLSKTPDQLRFKFISIRVAYTTLFIAYLIGTEVISMSYVFKNVDEHGPKFLKYVREAIWGGVFYGNALIASILFLKLASRWSEIMEMWHKVETSLRELPFPRLSRQFVIITAVIMIPAFCEQIFEMYTYLPGVMEVQENNTVPCKKNPEFNLTEIKDRNFSVMFQAYSCRSHWFIFSEINYNECTAAFLFVGARLALFIWNFTDLFIILVSIGLSARFAQFNQCVKDSEKKKMGEADWQKLREHYNMLAQLVRRVDNDISGIVLLSFTNNLICIALQLTKSMVGVDCPAQKAYFFVSFALLMARTIMVTISASQIHEESRSSLQNLYNCSSENYCTEASRLQKQMITDEIALTGSRIFSINRGFILVVAGCVFTYVVILMQFYLAVQDVMMGKMNQTTICALNITNNTAAMNSIWN